MRVDGTEINGTTIAIGLAWLVNAWNSYQQQKRQNQRAETEIEKLRGEVQKAQREEGSAESANVAQERLARERAEKSSAASWLEVEHYQKLYKETREALDALTHDWEAQAQTNPRDGLAELLRLRPKTDNEKETQP